MHIFGFEIRVIPWRERWAAAFLFAICVSCIVANGMETNWYAAYRYGEAIIPPENQLVLSGPYLAKKINTRNNSYIRFTSRDGAQNYQLEVSDFEPKLGVEELTQRYAGLPVAFLYLDTANSVRQVWGVLINGQQAMSYDRASFAYFNQIKSETGSIGSIFLTLLVSLISCFSLRRSAPKEHLHKSGS